MRLLHFSADGRLDLTKNLVSNDSIPPYAILSHRWREKDVKGVTFEDIRNDTGKNKPGYEKIQFCPCTSLAKLDTNHQHKFGCGTLKQDNGS